MSKSFAIAHRGAPRLAPENTLSALIAAKNAGAKSVECDVRLTKDHYPVIFHDNKLDRMTNGIGYVSQSAFTKIQSLRCQNQPIPTLLEWLHCCKKLDMHLHLEMKAHSKRQAKKLVDCVLRDLKKSHFPLSKLIVSSFFLECLMGIYKKNNKIALGLISHKIISDKILQPLSSMHFFSVHQYYKLLTEDIVNYFHQKGFSVLAYTVDDMQTAKKLKSIGVDGIFTNNEKLYGM